MDCNCQDIFNVEFENIEIMSDVGAIDDDGNITLFAKRTSEDDDGNIIL